MTKIAVFTTTRADFGIFKPLIDKLHNNEYLTYYLFVGGSHLSTDFGYTIKEIKDLDYDITDTFDYISKSDSSNKILESCGKENMELARIFSSYSFDFACILGDRYELLQIVLASILFHIPIIHLHGGEISEGAIDEQIRHMITKAAHLHFVACEEYAANVNKLGEQSWRIYNCGALAVDNMMQIKHLSKKEIFKKLNLNEELKTIIMTFHPVKRLSNISVSEQVKNIFSALLNFNFQIIVTAPGFDEDYYKIIDVINEVCRKNKNVIYIESLGALNFHSLLPHCEFIIGNSSSGIIEAPFFKIPTVNVGNRQKGRYKHISIIDTTCEITDIIKGINKAMSNEFHDIIDDMKYQFGEGNSAEKMVETIIKMKDNPQLLNKHLE